MITVKVEQNGRTYIWKMREVVIAHRDGAKVLVAWGEVENGEWSIGLSASAVVTITEDE